MSFLLGLTGSIGMGKSTTAALFAAEGIPVWDADGAVHALYARGGAGVKPVSEAFPAALVEGAIDRARLKENLKNSDDFQRLEKIIHPLVAAHRQGFLQACQEQPLVLLDIPLLYETGAESWLDAVVVVSAPAEVQRARVMQRPGMTEAHLQTILARQIPDAQKRARADYLIETSSLEEARTAVRALLERLKEGACHA